MMFFIDNGDQYNNLSTVDPAYTCMQEPIIIRLGPVVQKWVSLTMG